MEALIEKVQVADGQAWLVGGEHTVLVIDAPEDVAAILETVAGRRVETVVLSGSATGLAGAVALARVTGAETWLPAGARAAWDELHDDPPDHELVDGISFAVPGGQVVTREVEGAVAVVLPDGTAVPTPIQPAG